MLQNQIKKWIFPFLLVAGLGTLLHFTYDVSGQNAFVGLFSATSESTWEHLKLLFFPMVIYTVYQIFSDKGSSTVIPGNLVATLIGMLFIIVFFYTYTGVLGRDVAFIDIGLYYVAVILTLWLTCRLQDLYLRFRIVPAILVTLLFIILFAVFTYYPPDLGLFQSPL